ncbi:hypothetical protein ACFE04_020861 [Oxalis oulophora]
MTSSRLMFNHDIPKVISIKNIMIVAGNLTSQRLTKLPGTSLDYVFFNPSHLKSIKYVKEVKEGWFYETCVTRRDGPLCDFCSGFSKVIIPSTFVLFDDAATKFIGKTTFDVIDQIHIGGDDIIQGEHGSIPKKISSLLNRSFLFEIQKSGISLIGI